MLPVREFGGNSIMPRLLALLAILAPLASSGAEEVPTFGRHVAPLLYKLGCSAGTCHGSFSGKGGFRLALFASDMDEDYRNVRGGFGRRIDPVRPESSLLLLKPTGAVPHEGGVRLAKDGWEYRLLRDWIAAGAAFDADKETRVVGLRVDPPAATLAGQATALKVLAKLADGREDDVTRLARFESLDPGVAAVDAEGKVSGNGVGDAAVLAHYAGQVAFSVVLVPAPKVAGLEYPKEEARDAIDRMLLDRQKKLNVVPAPVCDDLTFLRRVHLDVVGQLPTPEEARAFLKNTDPNKRSKEIERLLADPLHAALWAGKLCDMVGADDRFLGNNVYNFHDWFRHKLEKNLPWDELTYGVLCATARDDRSPEQVKEDVKRAADERKAAKERQAKKLPEPKDEGKPWHRGYAERKTLDVFYNNLIHQQTIPGKPRIVDGRKIALRAAHTFLGVRLECAQCHKHPNDVWTQQDFLSFAAVFAHVGFGPDPDLKAAKVNLSGTHVLAEPAEEMLDPATGKPLPPRILGGRPIAMKPGVDPRRVVWEWLVGQDNPFFARAMVNRVWAHYMGRGLVEPADALAAANPPSHPEVLAELERGFRADGFDLRKLHRRILHLLAYQRDWRTNASNARDERNYSHRTLRRLTAEQALDAIAQATGVPVKLPKRYAQPREGEKAVEVALSRVSGDDGYVLQIFGRPLRVQNCDCERSAASSLSQVLYLFNDDKLMARIQDEKGRLKKLVATTPDDGKVIEELYLLTLTRFPTGTEIERSRRHLREAASRLEGVQDLLWSLLNRQEFIVNH